MSNTHRRMRETAFPDPFIKRRALIMRHLSAPSAIAFAVLCVACSGGGKTTAPATPGAESAAVVPGSPQQPDAGGVVDTVQMFTDAEGNYYKPKALTVHPGDVVRFVLASGVHNISFPADSNAGKAGLPAAGDYLQLPGQAYDIKVTFAPGAYYFQCDAHAALGMQGHLTVTPR